METKRSTMAIPCGDFADLGGEKIVAIVVLKL